MFPPANLDRDLRGHIYAIDARSIACTVTSRAQAALSREIKALRSAVAGGGLKGSMQTLQSEVAVTADETRTALVN